MHKILTIMLIIFQLGLIQSGNAHSSSLKRNITQSARSVDVVLTNSTLTTLTIEHADSAKPVQTLNPLETRTIATISQTASPKQAQMKVSNGSQTIYLTQKLTKNSVSVGARGLGFNIAPQELKDIKRVKTSFGGLAEVAFNTETKSSGHQVNYVIQRTYTKPNIRPANTLNVLAYNVWLTTIAGSKYIYPRLSPLAETLKGYDVLVGTEFFDDIPVHIVKEKLRANYPYHTGRPLKAGKVLTSGVILFSHWPIEREKHYFFNACHGLQCGAARAVVYAKINKQGNPYHVFGTHMQAYDKEPDRVARLQQLREMATFIKSLNIPKNEPVIYAGDFNINKVGLPQDRDFMEQILNAKEPQNLGHDVSYDSNTNFWAEKPEIEYLDYTLYSRVNLEPISASQTLFAPRSTIKSLWKKWDLSDHYAIKGTFLFNTPEHPVRSAFPYIGDTIHLKSHNGHFVRAIFGGNSFISVASDHIGTWESFRVIDRGNNKIALQTISGKYVSLMPHPLKGLMTQATIDGNAEFSIVKLSNSKIALKSANGNYLTAFAGGGAGLTASAKKINTWETFELIRP